MFFLLLFYILLTDGIFILTKELEQTNLSVDKQSFSNFPLYDLFI